jgi:hypothetical protein
MSTNRVRLTPGIAAVALLLFATPAPGALLNYEYGAAQSQLGLIRVLAERMSKQNLLFQLHLADRQKLEMLATVESMDEAIASLRKGDPLAGIPTPPTPEVRNRIDALEAAWAPLRASAVASPLEYLRRSREFLAPQDRRSDPLLMLHFDGVAAGVIEAADAVAKLYDAGCRADEYTHCDLVLRQGRAEMLTERMVKQAILVFTEIDPKTTPKTLAAARDAYEAMGLTDGAQRLVEQVTAAERAGEGVYMGRLLREINESWDKLRRRIDLVIEGNAQEDDIRQAVRIQELVVSDLQLFTASVTRFARIEQGGQGVPDQP